MPETSVSLQHVPETPEPRPRDDREAVKDIARDLAEIASHIGQLMGEANAYLTNPSCDRLKLRLENALSFSAVEVATISKISKGEAKGQTERRTIVLPSARR